MDTKFKNTSLTLAASLGQVIESIQGETITLRQLLELIGEQGLLFFCIILTLPFLLPVSIPGVSTIFGLVIILIGMGVTLNRIPWLPARVMNRTIMREHLVPTLEKGIELFGRFERWVQPRAKVLTEGIVMNRVNGLLLTFGGVLLIFPLGLVPFSNTLPALAVLLLAVGMLQRDGFFIVGGYIALVATIVYFAGLALGVIVVGQQLLIG